MNDFKKTWESYVGLWKLDDKQKMKSAMQGVLTQDCIYSDPLIQTTDLDALFDYICEFQKQFTGGYLETYYFLSHHNKSVAKWHLKLADATIIGDGVSFGTYNKNGELTTMSGFFDTPENG